MCGFTSCTFVAKRKETVKTFKIVQNNGEKMVLHCIFVKLVQTVYKPFTCKHDYTRALPCVTVRTLFYHLMLVTKTENKVRMSPAAWLLPCKV